MDAPDEIAGGTPAMNTTELTAKIGVSKAQAKLQPDRANLARVATEAVETAVERGIGGLPHRRRNRRRDADGGERRDEAPADRAAAKRPQRVEAPDLKQRRNGRDADRDANGGAQRRSLANCSPPQIEPIRRRALRDRHRPIEQTERKNCGEPPRRQHHDSDDDELERSGETVM
jgi:hypothetical protein